MKNTLKFSPLFALLLLSACVTVPSGPSVLVLPGTGKSFDQFRADDMLCRQFASSQVGSTPSQAATDSGVRSAAIGTVLGAAAGAAIGGNSRGAGIGAGTGLLLGSAQGTGASQSSAYGLQQRYDYSYIQCMYSYGHRVGVGPLDGGTTVVVAAATTEYTATAAIHTIKSIRANR